jgi:hypothetical protein
MNDYVEAGYAGSSLRYEGQVLSVANGARRSIIGE